MKTLLRKIRQLLKNKRFRRIWYRSVGTVAAIVVFVTTYALVLPAITMEIQAQCGIEAHQHDDSCYEDVLVCGLEESEGHTHDESCYSISQKLICEIPEHQHDETCYDEDGNLQCQLLEHTHTENCYEEVRELTCTLEESEGHHHTDACYEKNLICGKEVHIHSPACYEKEAEDAVAASAGYTAGIAYEGNEGNEVGDNSGTDVTQGAGNTGALGVAGYTDGNGGSEEADSAGPSAWEPPLLEESAAAATTNVLLPEDLQSENLSDGYVPQLDSLYFDAVLNDHTAFYYFHPEEGEEVPANSVDITSWKLVDKNTELAPTDLVKAYLAYTIPAGSLNETNQIARYRLPANIHLTDDQILAINNNENGIAAGYVDPATNTVLDEDADNYHKYLGAEAVEGTRRPDQDSRNAGEDGFGDTAQEYISATVKAENVFDEEGLYGEKGAYLGQDLIFVFSPYTIEKNQTTYDTAGNPTAKGEKVTGWFAVDLNMEQIDWSDPVETIMPTDNDNQTVAAEGQDLEQDQEQVRDQDQGQETVQELDQVSTGDNIHPQESAAQTTHTALQRIERTANVVFVAEGKDENNHKIHEISTELKLVQENEIEIEDEGQPTEASEEQAESPGSDDVEDTSDPAEPEEDGANTDTEAVSEENKEEQVEKVAPEYKDGTLEANGSGYKITMDYKADAQIPENAYLHVKEITRESDEEAYEACLEEARKSVPSDGTRVDDKASRFFDIEILVDEPVSKTGDDKALQENDQQNAVAEDEKVESDDNQTTTRKIEPAAPVSVNIQLFDTELSHKADEFNADQYKVVHIAEDGTEEIQDVKAQTIEPEKKDAESSAEKKESDPEATAVAPTTEVQFEAESFSIYGVVYTVDFHWEVDGKTYDFSIPGGGFVSLQHLVEVLGITGDTNSAENEADDAEKKTSEANEKFTEATQLTLGDVVVSEETREFVADVENVNFSNSELLWVGKVDADSTVGRLKKANGLECQYSAELTEEQIAEINAQTVTAGDWAIISMLPFDTEESLTVTMKNGEQFVVRITDARDPLGLDGRSFSIVNYRNNTWYALRGERNTTTQNNRGYYLFADSVSHTIANNTEYCGVNADAWLFEYNADEDAYYVSCNGMYLYIDPTITSKNDSNPNNNYAHALDLKAEKDQSDKGTLLKISRDDDGNYIFKSYSEKITLWDYGSNTYWLSNESQESGNEYLNSHMRLCLPEDSGSNASHKATLISAADTQPGQKIIIYQRVLDPATDTFTYYAINGKGGMEKVYSSSDSVYWKGDLNIEWTLTDLGNGYCTLYNEKENTYLTPKASKGTDNSFVVHKASDFDGSKHLNISLPGRDDGTYTSLISCWDYVDNATYGLKASETTGGGQVAIEPLLTSQPFYFAARDPIVHDQLTTVDTVDSVSKGIKITMYDWGDERGLDSHRQNWDGSNPAIQDRLPLMQGIMGATNSYADKYESGKVKPGILANYIDKENGQTAPNILKEDGTGNGHNLSELFSDDYIRTGTTAEKVNHLFLQSVYDETGFFKYSCFENYAYLPQGNDFTVYEQIGTPSNRTKDSTSTNIIYERGNFMPYNPINAAMNYRQNNYDPDLKELPDGDPRKGERLYYIENAFPSGSVPVRYGNTWFNGSSNPEAYANYYLGMKMEAKFSQNPGGYADNGDPMVFEFNGDDDLWIYLDNVLVLDMGGVHDAFRGKINFRTGDVTCNALNGENTTIKAMFKKAGKFPDGTDWDDARADEYFRGNTFKDFTTHNFKMFYMERGASASDLEMMFNLPVLTESQFRIKKELPETNDGEVVQSQYGDAPFYYKAYVYDANTNNMVPCTRQYLNSKGLDAPRYEGDGEVEWLDADPTQEIFLVKPGQTAVFPAIDDSVRWYTVEVAPPQNQNMLNKFSVSNSDQDNDTNYEVGVKSKERTILVRNLVIYQNRPDDELVNELQIKKKINGNAYNEDDAFEYRIYLEKTDGKLGVYRLGEYYQFDKDNNFVFYESGVRHTAKMEALSNGQYRYYDFDDGRPEETVDVQKITEHTSTNGSVGDVRDGDTIIIKGLLVGTDFYVYERTDYDYMSQDSTPVEEKYVFEGTDVTDAYTRNPETNKPENELIFNSLYGPPDAEAINNYPHSDYEREKAASGAIIEHKDAKILVKNKPYLEIPEGTITVQKKWMDEDSNDITSTVTDKSITYDIYRLVHVHDMELVVDVEPTDTEPGQQHYKCKHDGCDFVLPAEQISPKGHQWSEWERTQRPTCEEEGIWERHCLNPDCNETETWTEPAIGHDWDNGTITREATTTQTGIRHHVCQNDSSHTWDEEIPKLAGNIRYHIRNMYDHNTGMQIGSYQSDGTISAGTGNAIRVNYTLKSTHPDEKWAYGGSEQSIGRTEKYINYNYYYDYSVVIPIEEGKELYLYMEPGANSNRSNFKIEAIEYYGANSLSAVSKQQAVMHNVLGKVKVRTVSVGREGPFRVG